MDKLTLAAIAAAITTPVAGTAWLAWLLRRDRGIVWHPGDVVPHVPEDAAIRTWSTGEHLPRPTSRRR